MINLAVLLISVSFIMFVIPLLVFSSSYISIFKSAKNTFIEYWLKKMLQSFKDNVRVRQDFKAIKNIAFVLGDCIIIWMPSLVMLFVDCYYNMVNDSEKPNALWPRVDKIAFTSSTMNPRCIEHICNISQRSPAIHFFFTGINYTKTNY